MSQKLRSCTGESIASNARRRRATRAAICIRRAPTCDAAGSPSAPIRNPSFKSMRGYGVGVSFKKWAKIEAFGDTAVHPVNTVLRWERMVEAGAPVADVVGHLVKGVTGNRLWDELSYTATEKLTRRLHARGSSGPQPEAFLLEVYNPTESEIRLQVIFGVSVADVARSGKEPPLPRPRSIRSRCRPDIRVMRSEQQAFRQILDREHARERSPWCPKPTATAGWFS